MVMLPPRGIASRALSARLSSTCSSWPGSARTRPSSGERSSRTVQSSPIMRRTTGSHPLITWFRSSISARSTCRRLNASNWPVTAAVRSAAFWMNSTSARTASGMSGRRRMNSAAPMTTLIWLLASWATPPASRPTDSIRWACRSRSAVVLFSVTSVHTPAK
jgi:hypothetical protein